jgi:hypothetical protein
MKTLLSLVLAALGFVIAGCDSNLKSARSLRLPQGSAEKGKVAFVALQCTECHTVAGVDLPKPTASPEKVVELGGEVTRLRTLGDLMTSIIHPNYALSEKMRRPGQEGPVTSPMRGVNDVMTVAQLIDLITFLQPRYREIPPPMDFHYPLSVWTD